MKNVSDSVRTSTGSGGGDGDHTPRKHPAGARSHVTLTLQYTAAIASTGSIIALVLAVLSLSSNVLLSFSTSANIVASPSMTSQEVGSVRDGGGMVLIPQVSVSIGMRTACQEASCFQRDRVSGPISLVASAYHAVVHSQQQQQLSAEQLHVYQVAVHQFYLGFDSVEFCGRSRKSVNTLANFVEATLILCIISLAACTCMCVWLLVLVTRLDIVPDEGFSFHADGKMVQFGPKYPAITLPQAMVEVTSHLRYERPALAVAALVSLLATGFSVCTMSGTLSLVATKTKCSATSDVCSGYFKAMEDLIDVVTNPTTDAGASPTLRCQEGITYWTLIIVCVCTFMVCIAVFTFAAAFMHSPRRQQLLELKSAVEERIARAVIEGGDSSDRDLAASSVGGLSIQTGPSRGVEEAAAVHVDDVVFSFSSASAASDSVPAVLAAAKAPSYYGAGSSLSGVPPEHANRLGGCIAAHRERQCLKHQEADARVRIASAEAEEFSVLWRIMW